MELKTASSVINYISKIEIESADLYNRCADNYADYKDLFGSLAKENKQFGQRIRKAYYSSVTDALETNFGFQDLNAGIDVPKTEDSTSAADQFSACIKMERHIQAFYNQVADLSKGLLDDVNRVTSNLALSRDKRIEKLTANL